MKINAIITAGGTSSRFGNSNKLLEKINGYFLSMQQPPLDDLFFRMFNIKLHPAWLENEDDQA